MRAARERSLSKARCSALVRWSRQNRTNGSAFRLRFPAGARKSKWSCQAAGGSYLMLQTCKTVQEFLFQPLTLRGEMGIARGAALAPEFRQRQLRKFRRAAKVFSVVLVMNGQLFAGVNSVVRISNDFQPDLGGARVFTAALGHLREIPACLRAEFRRQPH